jgi:hypothetical protein
MKLFGRRITRAGWLKLSGLAFLVLVVVLLAVAPLSTVSVRIELPPTSQTPGPPTSSAWLGMLVFLFGWLTAVALVIGLSIWLMVGTVWKIIQAEPLANP